jgi:SAM-dependent methyltransferase
MYTKEYIEQLQSLHNDPRRTKGFGGKVKDLGQFHSFMNEWNPRSLLDYGCGKGHILAYLKETYPNTKCVGYDPAVPMFSKLIDKSFECVFSNDVLEHVEPDMIDKVLEHIDLCSTKYIWLRIDTLPARKKLPDGRNAHLLIQNKKWWKRKLTHFINGSMFYFELNKKGKLDVAISKVNP